MKGIQATIAFVVLGAVADAQDSGESWTVHDGDETTVGVGEKHICALEAVFDQDIGGELVCWGYGRDPFGLRDPPEGMFVQVCSSDYYSCAISVEEELVCWGGHGMARRISDDHFLQVTCGTHHACTLHKNGKVSCFGQKVHGQLKVPELLTFAQISAGDENTCGITQEGSLACWGSNRLSESSPPEGQFVQVALSNDRNGCALQEDGIVVCWGADYHDDGGPYHHFHSDAGLFVQITSGKRFMCGITLQGSIACPRGHGLIHRLLGGSRGKEFLEISSGPQTLCAIELEEPNALKCWPLNREVRLLPPGDFLPAV